MDTDDLIPMAYESLLLTEDVLDILIGELGALTSKKATEDDFLKGARSHLKTILRSARGYLDEWGYENEVDVREFLKSITELLAYVERTLAKSMAQRREIKTI